MCSKSKLSEINVARGNLVQVVTCDDATYTGTLVGLDCCNNILCLGCPTSISDKIYVKIFKLNECQNVHILSGEKSEINMRCALSNELFNLLSTSLAPMNIIWNGDSILIEYIARVERPYLLDSVISLCSPNGRKHVAQVRRIVRQFHDMLNNKVEQLQLLDLSKRQMDLKFGTMVNNAMGQTSYKFEVEGSKSEQMADERRREDKQNKIAEAATDCPMVGPNEEQLNKDTLTEQNEKNLTDKTSDVEDEVKTKAPDNSEVMLTILKEHLQMHLIENTFGSFMVVADGLKRMLEKLMVEHESRTELGQKLRKSATSTTLISNKELQSFSKSMNAYKVRPKSPQTDEHLKNKLVEQTKQSLKEREKSWVFKKVSEIQASLPKPKVNEMYRYVRKRIDNDPPKTYLRKQQELTEQMLHSKSKSSSLSLRAARSLELALKLSTSKKGSTTNTINDTTTIKATKALAPNYKSPTNRSNTSYQVQESTAITNPSCENIIILN